MLQISDEKSIRQRRNETCFFKIYKESCLFDLEQIKSSDLLNFLENIIIKNKYCYTYIISILIYLKKKLPNWPLDSIEYAALKRSLVKRTNTYTEKCYSVQNEYTLLFVEYNKEKILDKKSSNNEIIFSYAFLLMYITGKRQSEIANLDKASLINLIKYGITSIDILKTNKIGRLNLLDMDSEKRDILYLILNNIDFISIPYDVEKQRESNCNMFNKMWKKCIVGVEKPKNLSLHYLRRNKAINDYLQGKDINHIRDSLDHSSLKMTNMYINKGLKNLFN